MIDFNFSVNSLAPIAPVVNRKPSAITITAKEKCPITDELIDMALEVIEKDRERKNQDD